MATPPSNQAPPAPANATPPGPPARRLKPCPFCGGEAEFERLGTGRLSCIVVCYGCGARHESGDSGAASGESWNRRHAEPTVGSLLASLDTDHVVEFEDGEIATMQIGVNVEGAIVHRMWDGECWSAEWCEAEIQHRWLAMLGRLVSGEHVDQDPEARQAGRGPVDRPAVDRPAVDRRLYGNTIQNHDLMASVNVKRELERALRYQVPELRTVPMYVESCAKCAKAEQDLRQIKEALTAFRIYGNSTDPGLMVAAILGRAAEVVALEEITFMSGTKEMLGFGFCAGCGITMGNGCACKDKPALATVTFRGTEPELSAFKARLGRLWPAVLAPDHETHRARAVALMQLTNVYEPIPYDRLAAIAGEPANTLPREVRAIAVELYSRRLQVAEAAIGDVESARRLYRGVFTCATCDGTGRELIDCDGSAGYRPCPKGCPRP